MWKPGGLLIKILEYNSSRLFYEAMGGKKIDEVEVEVEIAGEKLNELIFGWDNIDKIFN